MLGVVIAAGRGARMGALTANVPKCLLPIGERALLGHTLDGLVAAGCTRALVITGYRHAQVAAYVAEVLAPILGCPIACLENPRAAEVNVLHSLMCAGAALEGPALITYSDTYYAPGALAAVARTAGDVVVGVDLAWRDAYVGRTLHPIAEAEKVYIGADGHARALGKQLPDDSAACIGEFVGALYASTVGLRTLRDVFARCDVRLAADAPFQRAARWSQAYLTDLLQECVDQEVPVRAALLHGGWAELDTPEDYARVCACPPQQFTLA